MEPNLFLDASQPIEDMETNPFRDTPQPIKSPKELFPCRACRNELISWLNGAVLNRANSLLYGVQGSGKTSLLNSYFTLARKLALVQNTVKKDGLRTIICRHSFEPEANPNGTEILSALLFDLSDAVNELLSKRAVLDSDTCSALERAAREVISPSLHQIAEGMKPKDILDSCIIALKACGFSIVVVWDHFEEFTFSPYITWDDHNTMCSLLQAARKDSQASIAFIAATDYDLHRGSLPYLISAEHKGISLFLQLLTHEMTLEPISFEDAQAFLTQRLEGHSVQFSEALCQCIYDFSGGIPSLLEYAASKAYDLVCYSDSLSDDQIKDKLKSKIFSGYQIQITSWFKSLTEQQAKLLDTLFANEMPADSWGEEYIRNGRCQTGGPFEDEINELRDRGLLKPEEENDDVYIAACPLLKDIYALWRKKHPDLNAEYEAFQRTQRERASDKQLLERESALQEKVIQTALEALSKSANINMTVQAENLNLHADQVSVTANVTANILGILQETGKDLNASLLKAIFPSGLPQVELMAGEDPEEFALRRDAAFVEQTKDLLPPPPEDQSLQTLDELFQEARQHEDFSHLDKETLAGMSPACQFYVKMGVVIQDKLRFMEELSSESMDYSAQLVFYGKALEQELKDCFFDLFHTHASLSDYLTNVSLPKKSEKLTFAQLTSKDQTYIGTYWNLIKNREQELANLCSTPDRRLDKWWWKGLWISLQQAGLIRNLADHAGKEAKWIPRNWLRDTAGLVDEQIGSFESPSKGSMDLMFALLFGGSIRGDGREHQIDGVFQRIKQAGEQLPSPALI